MMPSDEEIRKMAKARVEFRRHLMAYIVVNLFLVGVWWFTDDSPRTLRSYWPIWVHLGWGMGLAFSWYSAYGPGVSSIEAEERKIRERLGRS